LHFASVVEYSDIMCIVLWALHHSQQVMLIYCISSLLHILYMKHGMCTI